MPNFIPYGQQSIDENDIQAVLEVLKSDYLTQGPKIDEFEKAICDYTGAKYCVAVSNGTAALHLAVASLEIEPGKEGITSTNSFTASSNCLIYNNLKPIFADIDPKTYCIDPKSITNHLSANTKLLIPVHFAGQTADMEEIKKTAINKKLFIIEDAAHAIGSSYPNGKKVGSCCYADLTTFSFHPVKTITTGEGGAITTNNKQLYERLLTLRSHGITKDLDQLTQKPGPWFYEMHTLGFNYRLTDIQAALGLSQLGKLEDFVSRRRKIVKRYNQAFSKLKNCIIPFENPDTYSAFHLYVLQIDFEAIKKNRKQVMDKLKDKGIGTQVHYIPIHLQPYYQRQYGYKAGDYPIAETYYQKALSLPLYPKMTDEEIDYVIKSVKEVIDAK